MKGVMKIIQSPTLRGIIEGANELNIKKEDIVALLKENEVHLLVYYGEK